MPTEEHHIEEAAYLRANNHTIGQIAVILNLSEGAVFNLLNKAKSKGFFRELVEFDAEKFPPERLHQLEKLNFAEHLSENLQASSPKRGKKKYVFQQVRVFDSGTFDEAERMFETRLKRFGIEVASHLCEILTRSHCVGVSWGMTLSACVHALTPSLTFRFRNRQPIWFIPSCGEPLGMPLRTDSASHLALELDQRINRSTRHSLSLSGVPVVIPKVFLDRKQKAVIEEFIHHCPAYREIFGEFGQKSHRRIDELDTILTSVGTLDSPWRMCGIELCKTGGINPVKFRELVLGDIGGVLLPKHDTANDSQAADLAEMETLWTGIQMSTFQKVANTADQHRPGVVALAIGANKATIVRRCVKLGLINHLICDETLAWELCQQAGSPTPDQIRSPG